MKGLFDPPKGSRSTGWESLTYRSMREGLLTETWSPTSTPPSHPPKQSHHHDFPIAAWMEFPLINLSSSETTSSWGRVTHSSGEGYKKEWWDPSLRVHPHPSLMLWRDTSKPDFEDCLQLLCWRWSWLWGSEDSVHRTVRRILERFQTQDSSQHSQFRFSHWLPLPQPVKLSAWRSALFGLCTHFSASLTVAVSFSSEGFVAVSPYYPRSPPGWLPPSVVLFLRWPEGSAHQARQRLHYVHQYLPSLILEPCMENSQTLQRDWTSGCTLWNQKYTFSQKWNETQ